MTTFKVGDCVWKHFPTGTKCTADIVDLHVDENGETTYRYVLNGIVYDRNTNWTFEPNLPIPSVYDPSYLKQWTDTREKMWYGTSITYRAPEADDDEKRSLWQAKNKKHEDALAALMQRCAPFKKGTAVVWNSWWCCFASRQHNGCVPSVINKGIIDSEVTSDFKCNVKTADGISHNMSVWVMGMENLRI